MLNCLCGHFFSLSHFYFTFALKVSTEHTSTSQLRNEHKRRRQQTLLLLSPLKTMLHSLSLSLLPRHFITFWTHTHSQTKNSFPSLTAVQYLCYVCASWENEVVVVENWAPRFEEKNKVEKVENWDQQRLCSQLPPRLRLRPLPHPFNLHN